MRERVAHVTSPVNSRGEGRAADCQAASGPSILAKTAHLCPSFSWARMTSDGTNGAPARDALVDAVLAKRARLDQIGVTSNNVHQALENPGGERAGSEDPLGHMMPAHCL